MGNAFEPVPAAWSMTDEQFFRSTASLFPPEFLWGSGTLLATYDETAFDAAPVPVVRAAGLRQDTARRRRAAA